MVPPPEHLANEDTDTEWWKDGKFVDHLVMRHCPEEGRDEFLAYSHSAGRHWCTEWADVGCPSSDVFSSHGYYLTGSLFDICASIEYNVEGYFQDPKTGDIINREYGLPIYEREPVLRAYSPLALKIITHFGFDVSYLLATREELEEQDKEPLSKLETSSIPEKFEDNRRYSYPETSGTCQEDDEQSHDASQYYWEHDSEAAWENSRWPNHYQWRDPYCDDPWWD